VILHGIFMILLGASRICILSSIEWFIVWFYLLVYCMVLFAHTRL
jgi:hypothetical protein